RARQSSIGQSLRHVTGSSAASNGSSALPKMRRVRSLERRKRSGRRHRRSEKSDTQSADRVGCSRRPLRAGGVTGTPDGLRAASAADPDGALDQEDVVPGCRPGVEEIAGADVRAVADLAGAVLLPDEVENAARAPLPPKDDVAAVGPRVEVRILDRER